jgi:uncharacterized protein (DUF302 family)
MAASTSTYRIPEPFTTATRSVRDAIQEEGLRKVSELDVADRSKHDFGISLPACRILFAECPTALLKALALDRSAVVWLPMHVVVSAQGPQTAVHIPRPSMEPMDSPVRFVQDMIVRALQRIGTLDSVIGGAAG